MPRTTQTTPASEPLAEALPATEQLDRSKLKQPTRIIQPPLENTHDLQSKEPDSAQSVRGRDFKVTDPDTGQKFSASVPAAPLTSRVMDDLAANAAQNDTLLPPQSRLTTTQNLADDPHAVQPVYTDPASQRGPGYKKGDERTRIRVDVGPVNEAIESQEETVKVRPKKTFSRFVGPYRYYCTKDVVAELPKSVAEALLREELVTLVFY